MLLASPCKPLAAFGRLPFQKHPLRQETVACRLRVAPQEVSMKQSEEPNSVSIDGTPMAHPNALF